MAFKHTRWNGLVRKSWISATGIALALAAHSLTITSTANAQNSVNAQTIVDPGSRTASGSAAQVPTSSPTPVPVDETSDSKWHLYSLGYLWLPGIHGTVGVNEQEASVSVSPIDLLKNFRFGIMGTFIPTYNRWSFPLDYFWVRLKDDNASDVNPAYAAEVKVTQSILTPKVAYLLVNDPKVKIYANAGIRYWYLGNTLDVTPPIAGFNPHASADWVDFVAGGRFNVPLSPKASIDVIGDAGGGAADLDYQVVGLINYRVKPKVTLQAGWRYLTVHYRDHERLIFDSSSSGLVFGATYKFK